MRARLFVYQLAAVLAFFAPRIGLATPLPVGAVDGTGKMKPGKCLVESNIANTTGFQICQGSGASTDYQLKTFTGGTVLAEVDQANGFFYSANSFYSGTGTFYTATASTPVTLKGNVTSTGSVKAARVGNASVLGAGDKIFSVCSDDPSTCSADYLTVNFGGDVDIAGNVSSQSGAGTIKAGVFQVTAAATSAVIKSNATNGGAAVGTFIGNTATLSTAGAQIIAFCADTPTTCASKVAYVDKDGYIKQATPHSLFSAYLNAILATGTVYAGHKPEKAFTVTAVHAYVSVVASGAGNDVFTVTDGSNTCTATFSCTADFNTTGAKRVATANGAGTGCVYAADATLSISLTTAGCATTQGTVKNIDVVGKWQ